MRIATILLGFAAVATVVVLLLRQGDVACVDATFKEVVLYAGATDFLFELPSGARIAVRESHDALDVEGSAALVGRASDGPAEAAPDRVGRVHRLCFPGDGVTIALLPG